MDFVALTRQLVDIESITGNEGPVGDFLSGQLNRLGYEAKKMRVEGERCNVYATTPQQPQPTIVFSTHMDTVPPFIRSSEDDQRIYGRGSCDAKGIIAAQIAAAEQLRLEGIYVGLLFLVGEERDSLGAKVANQQANDCKFLINGEPTDKAHGLLLYRLIGPSNTLRREIAQAVGNLAKVEFTLEIPFVRLRTFENLPTLVAAFTTDIPALSNWGQPLLVGPGSIHVAH